MAPGAPGSHIRACTPGSPCPHSRKHAAHTVLQQCRHLVCPFSQRHVFNPGSATNSTPRANILVQALHPQCCQPQQLYPRNSRRRRWCLARRNNAVGHLSIQLLQGPAAAISTFAFTPGRHMNFCLPPLAASGAASGGPAGRTNNPPPQGAASAAGHQFNPRYQHHQHQYQQHQQQHQMHPNQHIQHHNHPGASSGRGGAWGTQGPLAPSGGPNSGSNPRYESSRSVTRSPAKPDESGLLGGGAGAAVSTPCTVATPPSPSVSTVTNVSATSVSAAPWHRGSSSKQGPRSEGSNGPAVPHQMQPPSLGSLQPAASASPQSDGRSKGASERTQLERLFVKDFALVSEQTVRLGPGLNVITGESGSGKSVLVEAFSQVLGAPAPQECVRAPAELAVIEGTFVVGSEQREAVWQLLSSCGLPQKVLLPMANEGAAATAAAGSSGNEWGIAVANGGQSAAGSVVTTPGAFRLTIRREISQAPAGGVRSRVFLNGVATSLRVLKELGALLVDTNGQHSAMSLRDSVTQLDLLDRIAGTSSLADGYCAAMARLRQLEGRLDELDELDDEQERATMQKLVDAVAKLRVQPGEERELRRMLKKMEARRVAVEQCGLVRLALCGEAGAGGVTDALRTIEAQLNAILAQEEQNRVAAKGTKGKDGKKVAESDAAGVPGNTGAAANGGDDGGEDEEEEEAGEGGGGGSAAAGLRMMEEALEQVAAAKDMLAAAETTVRAYARRYQFSQADHDATSERLARIERLMKHASAAVFGATNSGGRLAGGRRGGSRIVSTEQLLEIAEECSAKLASYYEMEGQRAEWEAQLDTLVSEIRATALQLSSRRRAAAAALRAAVESCLRELAMGGSRFDVRIGWAEERTAAEGLYVGEEEAEEAGVAELGGRTYVMGARGLDQVEFLLAAGPAEPLRPLAAVASGGESARVMLALKAAPAHAGAAAASSAAGAGATGGVPIMILDELDSGIGARLGSAVGSILARMAMPTHGCNSQIICVTHLPQVACYAAHHIKVQKELPHPFAAWGVGRSGGADDVDGGEVTPGAPAPGPAAIAPRVTTSFVPLASFEERCQEVAAMLGLDRGVAEEMLYVAQTQVAAMYPAGTLPEGFLTQGPNYAAKRNDDSRGGVAATTTPLPSAEEDRAFGSRAGSVRRVVQDALRVDDTSGRRSSAGFSVVVSPSMDPNAVLIGGEGPGGVAGTARVEENGSTTTGSSSGTVGGRAAGRTAAGRDGELWASLSDADDEDREAAEAELSAQLLAGIEAAAMQHLQRMEAQAKAAAAAAAAAAAIVSPIEAAAAAAATGPAAAPPPPPFSSPSVSPFSPPLPPLPPPPPPPPTTTTTTTAPAMMTTRGHSILQETEAAVEAKAVSLREEGRLSVASDFPQAVDPFPNGPYGSFELPEATAEAACHGATDPAGGDLMAGQDGDSGGHTATSTSTTTSTATSTSSPPVLRTADGVAQESSSSSRAPRYGLDVPIVNATAATGKKAENSNLISTTTNKATSNDVAVLQANSSDLIVTVQPSRSPLPYNFGVDVDDDHDGDGDDNEQSELANPHSTYDLYDMQNGIRQGQQGSVFQSDVSVYDGAVRHDEYTYGVGAGGRFVVVPTGHENEFDEMFRTILSFSREDYEGEALRSYEATLMQALRDAGLS